MDYRIRRMGVRDCSSGWIRCRGLPYSSSSIEVAQFLEDFGVTKEDVTMSVHRAGPLAGYCNGELRDQETATRAQKALHKSWVDERYVEIYPMSEEERYMAEAFELGHRNQWLQHAAEFPHSSHLWVAAMSWRNLLQPLCHALQKTWSHPTVLHRSQVAAALATEALQDFSLFIDSGILPAGCTKVLVQFVAMMFLHQILFVVPWTTREPSVARRSMKPSGPPLPSEPMGVPWSKAGGAVVVELFLDLCCPFSKRMLHTVAGDVAASYEGKVNFIFHTVVQPWHAQSSYMHEASLAVLKLHGPEAFWKYVVALSEHQENYFDDKTFDKSRQQIYRDLAILAHEQGYDDKKIMARLQLAGLGNAGNAVTQHLKWATKFHRVRGVHVTPTVFVNGLEAGIVSSDWSPDEWKAFLDWHVNKTSS
eukprot:symbB.v1.2.015183.t1/scaffold1044.1/size142232/4